MTSAALRALVVDDEPLARRRLRALLKGEPSIDIVGEAGDGPAAVEAIERLTPDLVFLDVQMPGRDGFDVIEEVSIRNRVACPAIIFVTAFDEYAVRAFDVHAIDYLLKPFDRGRLRQAIERASARVAAHDFSARLGAAVRDATRHRPLRRFLVRTSGRILFVDAESVDWLEAADHYVTLHVGRQTHLLRERLTDLAARLDPARFARIHRGTIVNLERVKELHAIAHGEFSVVLKDGTVLHATRTFAARLARALS